jgi:hypothetical protein
MFTVNPNPNYKPEPFQGDGYQELSGATVIPFLKHPTWTKDGMTELLRSREIDANGDGKVTDSTMPAMLYKGTIKDRTVALVLGDIKDPLRAFAVNSEVEYQALKEELQRNKGFLDQQMADVGKVFTNNDADALYAWQDRFFGYTANNQGKIVKQSSISKVKAQQALKGTKGVVIDEKEAVNLIKEICKRYNVYNVEVLFFNFDGRTRGWCRCSEDSITPLSRPVGIQIGLARQLLLKSTAIHETAHAIEFFKTGVSGHGKGFRSIFKLLLKQYMQIDPVGL